MLDLPNPPPPPSRVYMGSENDIFDYLAIPMALLLCCLFAVVVIGMQRYEKLHIVPQHTVCAEGKGND